VTEIEEGFTTGVDPRLTWLNEPPRWRLGAQGLTLGTAAGSDFWQGTHYGFRVDNGHALLAQADGRFVLEVEVETSPRHQYDQAGVLIRLSAQDWLKASVEFEPGEPSRLGCVVTNHGWSDWSTQDVDPQIGRQVAFRVTREGADYLVEAMPLVSGRWSQIRLARLQNDDGGPIAAGLYACSPKDAGFEATFRRLRLFTIDGSGCRGRP
jgi:regulation of enolase protein 1 (concanavalin A-like superfamily)